MPTKSHHGYYKMVTHLIVLESAVYEAFQGLYSAVHMRKLLTNAYKPHISHFPLLVSSHWLSEMSFTPKEI